MANGSAQRDDLFLGFFGGGHNSSVILDAGDNSIMAYSDESMPKLASWNGDGLDVDTVAGAGADPLGQQSIAQDHQGTLHLTPWQMCVTNRNHPSQDFKGDPGVAVAKLPSYPCRHR